MVDIVVIVTIAIFTFWLFENLIVVMYVLINLHTDVLGLHWTI